RGATLARRRCLARRCRARCLGPRRSGPSADPPALARRRVAFLLAAARAALLAAAALLVDGRPGAPLGFLVRHAGGLVALGDVIGLAVLLIGVLGFAAPGPADLGHDVLRCVVSPRTGRTPRLA